MIDFQKRYNRIYDLMKNTQDMIFDLIDDIEIYPDNNFLKLDLKQYIYLFRTLEEELVKLQKKHKNGK